MFHPSYLQINNITKQFGSFAALKDISLSIEQGEFICFLGPSGCGKTTLLRTIAGLDFPTSGSIFQHNQETTFLPPEKRDFGIVFQSYALFPNLTVKENIGLGLISQGMSKKAAEIKVQHWLDTIGLPTSGHKFPSQLSGGQQQRVALARALALCPGLLLLDEPLSALDAKVRVRLRDEICNLQRKLGITTIMVTHDQDEALAMADRIVVMNHGVIEQIGTPQEIYRQPSTRFVAEFVGVMNFIPLVVVSPTQVRIANTLLAMPRIENLTLAVGDSCDLAVRPEQIRFVSTPSNGIAVHVMATEFLGAFYRVDCQIICKHRHVDCQITVDVPIEQAQRLNIKRGDLRYIEINAAQLRGYLNDNRQTTTTKAA